MARDHWGENWGPDPGEIEYHLTSKTVVLIHPQPSSHCNLPDRKKKQRETQNVKPASVSNHGPIPLNSSPVQKIHMDINHSENYVFIRNTSSNFFFLSEAFLKIQLGHVAKAIQLTNG